MSFSEKINFYKSSYSTTVIHNVPIIINCKLRNFSKLTKDSPQPYCKDLYDLLSNVLFESIIEIDGAIFGYQSHNEFDFILGGSSNSYHNSIQEIGSIVSSYVSSKFTLLNLNYDESKLNFTGYPVFSSVVFPVPNIKEVLYYLIWRQNIGLTKAKKKIEKNPNYLEKIDYMFGLGTAAYKIPKINQDKLSKRWNLNTSLPSFEEDEMDNGNKLISGILETGQDIFRPEI